MIGRGWIEGLLGLVSAHFDNEVSSPAGVPSDEAVIAALNAGIAVITPSENIRELLMSDEMKEDRRERGEKLRKQAKETAATADFVIQKKQRTHARKREDRIDIPIPTRGGFVGDLARATRRKKASE